MSTQLAQDRAARISAWLAVIAGVGLLCDSAGAQESVPAAELRHCAGIARGAERLDCYDALARALAPDRPAADGAPAASAEAARADGSGVDAFGSELIEDDDASPREIQSRHVGEFTGWRGNTEFRLENGQVWRQVGQGRLVWTADSPLVTIRRGAFNAYRLGVEGVNSSVRVRRIR